MFMVVHALMGILIANEVHSKILILILGIISHFLMDMIPHWDGPFNRKEFGVTGKADINRMNVILHAIDIGFIVWVIYSLADLPHSGILIFGIFCALIPDLAKIGYLIGFKDNHKYMSHLKFHARIQRDATIIVGLLIQLIFALVILYFIPQPIF